MAAKPAEESHVVTKGECLWWIAEYEDVYNDPFMWPLIYDANKDQVQDPDLIYPDQVLRIPRSGYTVNEVESARKTAGAPRPYVVPVDSLPPM
ncbi:MAG: LysM peptidoglycan-binding domain-containing protein [Deltaproteobacteria bacterium]|nr:LysM peptidoglycan-binding domain-containing protein [Deltaproteobacteria bacterium]